MFFVYVLRSGTTGRLYTGSCSDLSRRLHEHNAGQSPATRHGSPWLLLHTESFPTRAQAYARERFLKTGAGRDELARTLAAQRG